MSPNLELDLVSLPAGLTGAPAVAVPIFEEDPLTDVQWLPDADRGEVLAAMQRREFLGKPSQLFLASSRTWPARLLFVGVGRRDAASLERWRRAAGTVGMAARARGLSSIAFVARTTSPPAVQAIAEGLHLSTWDVDRYRTAPRDAVALSAATVAVDGAVSDTMTLAFARGNALGRSTNTARALANEPGNVLPPRELATRASAVAQAAGLRVDVLTGASLAALGMELLLGVGRGSAEPSCLIDISYEPAEAPAGGPVLGLVGKGVTFDTGGISIKPADQMDRMKFDMAGAAAVVGALEAIAALRPPVRVRAIIPAAENMPGGRAIRPGDVLRSASGKTVEINNTDAEGRLILADALWYARARAGVTHLVDVATLTGAIGIALGRSMSGLFGTHQAFTGLVREVADEAGDPVWPMPLHEDYSEQLKSDIADLINTGGRAAGANTAAAFLQAFAGDGPWVHLDVAATAWLDEPKPWMPKGPTGVMTRTLASLALAHERLPR
jgi:leucyl aminopeptidase